MCAVTSVVSDSLQPYGLLPARLLCPWDSPDKGTGVGCIVLLQVIFLAQGSNQHLLWSLHWRWILYCWATGEALNYWTEHKWLFIPQDSSACVPTYSPCFVHQSWTVTLSFHLIPANLSHWKTCLKLDSKMSPASSLFCPLQYATDTVLEAFCHTMVSQDLYLPYPQVSFLILSRIQLSKVVRTYISLFCTSLIWLHFFDLSDISARWTSAD